MTDAKESAAALRRRALIVEACRARIVRAVELNRTLGLVGPKIATTLPSTGSDIDRLAARLARTIEGVLDAYRYPADNRGAMAVRLAEHWPLDRVPDDQGRYWFSSKDLESSAGARIDLEGLSSVEIVEDGAVHRGALPPRITWPSNVSFDDVVTTIERSRDPRAKDAAQQIRAMFPGATHMFAAIHTMRPWTFGLVQPKDLVPPRPEGKSIGELMDWFANNPAVRAELDSPFHPSTAALVVWAAKVVLDAQAKARAFPLPSRREARVAFDILARQKTLCADERRHLAEATREGGVRIVWDGRPRAEQRRFAFAALDVEMREVVGIKDELGAEGVRDYLILHKMADAHGRTGTFVWTWAQHRKATRHHTRIRASNVDDAKACDAVVQRIHRLARAQLHVEVELDGRRAWKVIGEEGLVVIVGGVERKGGSIEGLKLRLNKALYAGASRDAKRAHYTMIPEAVLELPAAALCLATLLVFQWRYAVDESRGTVVLDEDKVLRLMDETSLTATRHQTRAAGKMRRTLDDVVRAMGDGCTWEPVEGEKVRITPPTWWVDHAVHGAPMPHPLPPAQHPRTGVELVAWRREHKLTQAEAAAALGVGERTIRNAEARGSDALPRSFVDVPWGAPRRALPKGRA